MTIQEEMNRMLAYLIAEDDDRVISMRETLRFVEIKRLNLRDPYTPLETIMAINMGLIVRKPMARALPDDIKYPW